MNVKKIKRKCMVKGCRNTETYTISKVRDFGDTVLICPSCLKEAAAAIENYAEVKAKEKAGTPPAMFYTHLTKPVEAGTKPNEIEPKSGEAENKFSEAEFICSICATPEVIKRFFVAENIIYQAFRKAG